LHNAEVVLDLGCFDAIKRTSDITPRKFSLNVFNVDTRIKENQSFYTRGNKIKKLFKNIRLQKKALHYLGRKVLGMMQVYFLSIAHYGLIDIDNRQNILTIFQTYY